MPHEILKADLFSSPGNVFAHGCNAYGVMGGGIALHIRNTYPLVYLTYRDYFEKNGLNPGDIIPSYFSEEDDRIMLNVITQIMPGPNAEEEFIYQGLQNAVDYCTKIGEEHLSIPAIGCGIGGLELYDLTHVLDNLDTDVMVHIFIK